MKSDPAEYKDIIGKLLEKTRQRKVEWQQEHESGFQCTVVAPNTDSFLFRVFADERGPGLRMSDQDRNTIFYARSNDLPTSPEEEEVSNMIEEIYGLARRQALKIEQKLILAADVLDRV